MTRLIAAALVIACMLALNSAQEKGPVLGRGSSTLPWEITTQNGKAAWHISGRGTVSVEDLVGGLSNATSLRVSFTQQALGTRRSSLTFLMPDAGMTLSNDEIPGFCAELLAGNGLALAGFTKGSAKVCMIEEASGMAVLVTEQELGAINGAEWVTVNLALVNARAHDTLPLFNLYRASNLRTVEYPGGLVVSGPADRVRTVVKLLRDMDKPGAAQSMVRSYDLPDNVRADAARAALAALFPSEVTEVQNVDSKVTVTSRQTPRITLTVSGGNRLIVVASVPDHALVQQAIAALK